jgi:hypothetical protein
MQGAERARGAGIVALRVVTIVDATVFLTASLQNMGLGIPLGVVELRFPVPIWQAGIGEAVIGATLLVAVVSNRMKLFWTAYGLSVLGIAFGLLSARVVGPARDIHVLLVPLALLGLGLLVIRRRSAMRELR